METQQIVNRIKDLKKLLLTVTDEYEKKAFIIQLKTLLPEATNTLRIDADGLIYMAAKSPKYKKEKDIQGTFQAKKQRITLKQYKVHFDEIVKSVVDACEYQSLIGNMARFKDYELVFSPSRNFRYDLYPAYKNRRAERPRDITLDRLKKYVKLQLGVVPDNIEADDYVIYYGRKGDPVASSDKDVINSIEGGVYWYHKDHKEVIKNNKKDCERWVLLQTIAGDYNDDIPGIPGVALKTAEKLLPPDGTFEDVIDIYKSKGLTKDDAVLTRRLVGMDQWTGPRRNKIRLFT